MLEDTDTAVSVRYLVKLDEADLGTFSSCEGLGIEVVLETREEGGNNGFVWQLPTRLKFPNVKLTRPLGAESAAVVTWMSKLMSGYRRGTGTISAMTAAGRTVVVWSLDGVVPVRWTGPSLTNDSPKVVTETLEIAHHGVTASRG
ncbi:phage tail protein [uncultured Amnibacterium sp.]|uniref:phage tail protein n=1 Tax=uncultured Amnibacterium sp. TaxID=1631851 RepID=UPI0035CAEC34